MLITPFTVSKLGRGYVPDVSVHALSLVRVLAGITVLTWILRLLATTIRTVLRRREPTRVDPRPCHHRLGSEYAWVTIVHGDGTTSTIVNLNHYRRQRDRTQRFNPTGAGSGDEPA